MGVKGDSWVGNVGMNEKVYRVFKLKVHHRKLTRKISFMRQKTDFLG